MYQLTFVCISSSGLKFVDETVAFLKQHPVTRKLYGRTFIISSFYIGEARSQTGKYSAIVEAIQTSSFIFLDLMGADGEMVKLLENETRSYAGNLAIMGAGTDVLRSRIRLGAFEFKKMAEKMGQKKSGMGMKNMEPDRLMAMAGLMGKVSRFSRGMHHWLQLQQAWSNAGVENIKNMILVVLREYGGFKQLPCPGKIIDYSSHVLFDPRTQTGYKTFKAFQNDRAWDVAKPNLGLLFSSINYPYYNFGIMAEIMERLSRDFNLIPLGVHTGEKKFKLIEKHLAQGMSLDLVWDFLPFRFGAGPMGGNEELGLSIFRQFNVPVMHPFFMNRRRITDWEKEVAGLGPAELIICTMLPEMDGVTDTIPMAGLRPIYSNTLPDLSEISLIPERFERFRKKSLKLTGLRTKKNHHKKIAIIIYNYPPGEGNVGGGAFLDTFKSVENIVCRLKVEGYHADGITGGQMEETFMDKGMCNTPSWSGEPHGVISYPFDRFQAGAREVPGQELLERCTREWGPFPGRIMTGNKGFYIPGILDKNLFVGLQPSRGTVEVPDKNYHDKALPPHHQYMAFYRWLRDEFKADAIVHVGTHGTLEFLPGKESGMSCACYPDYLIGDLPHFYYYHSGNPSEATIAKRRSHGCLISYSGPGFKHSGAYGKMLELEGLLEEFQGTESLSVARKNELYQKILEQSETLDLMPGDPRDVDDIAAELVRLKTALMPLGLHLIGQGFSPDEATSFVAAILAWDRGELSGLPGIIKAALPDDTPEIHLEERAWELSLSLIKDRFFGSGALFDSVKEKLAPESANALERAMVFGQECLTAIQESDELGGLVRGLGGEFIEARLGGDLIRDPEVFPTGYNLFQFDARKVPSATAMVRGKQIADSTLHHYLKENNTYPESVSVVLWGLETSRTKGETLGQILHYLGVRLVSSPNSFEKKFELIPLEELGRPRIDVVVSLCGFFRDMFPNIIEFLDEIFEAVCLAQEPKEMNFFRKHARAMETELMETMAPKEARELSWGRLFGPPEGEYGTGLTTLINNRAWEDESDLAQGFIGAQKHLYSRNRRGQAQRGLFESNLKQVDIVSQVRSSVDYSIADLDHYYEYFGGLSRSVEEVTGKKPTMLYTDSSSSTIYTDEAGKAIQISVRTRLLNPEYINALLEHQVHGAQHLADRVENLIGLSATTGRVASWIFSSVKETLLDDREMLEKLKKNNAFALHSIMERLFEANNRGYWDARNDELNDLRELYLAMEGEIEEKNE